MEDRKNGKLVAWSTSIFPQEISQTFGITVTYPENHSAGIASRHQAESFLQYAEGEREYPSDVCSYAKINLAYMDLQIAENNKNMPRPDFILCINNICNQLIKWYQNIAKELNIPMFIIDVPYNYEKYVTENRVRYIRSQIEQCIHDVEAFTGIKFDWDKFTRVMEQSKINQQLWREVNELLDHVPSPLQGFDLFSYMSCMVCCRGFKSTEVILRQLKKELLENIEKGESSFPVEEQFRIYWEGIACWPHLSHNLKTMKKYGINVVATGYVKAWDLEYETNDLDGMARAYTYTSGNNVSMEELVERRVDALTQFHCDGMVYHVNRSCKVMACWQYEMQRRITDITGLPFATFDGDQSDWRNYSEAQYETRIQAFYEVMKANKEARQNG